MNTCKNTNIFLLCIVIVLLLIVLLKKHNERFQNKIDLNLYEYLILSNGAKNKKIDNSNKLSKWESSRVLDNPRLSAIYNRLYNRSCKPAFISRMGKYEMHLP